MTLETDMPIEIERKFLISGDGWRAGARTETIAQGYLSTAADCSIRVRILDEQAFLTIKGPALDGARPEFEYPIPLDHARQMLGQFCTGRMIAKRRHSLTYEGLLWTVDEFEGPLSGLLLAEVELDHVGQAVALPPWIGREVTDDPRYLNSVLSTAKGVPVP
jgi:CYTH domain-containing protein